MWFFLINFSLCFFVLYVYIEMSSYHNTHVYSTSKLVLWQLRVLPGIIQGLLVAWGHYVHQQPRRIVVETTVRYMLGKDCFVTVVEDYDSGQIFVRVRNFE
jgi:predicted permease